MAPNKYAKGGRPTPKRKKEGWKYCYVDINGKVRRESLPPRYHPNVGIFWPPSEHECSDAILVAKLRRTGNRKWWDLRYNRQH